MNKEAQKIVPELRFSGFSDGWKMMELGNKKVSFFVNDKTLKEELDIETYISTENLLADYGGVRRSNKLPDSGSFTTYKKGDILIANIRPYLKKVWFADKEGATSNDVIVFRASSSVSDNYLQHILKNDDFINYVMKGAKGVKMPRGDKSLMQKYPVCFPEPNEQKKIANCLSTLDNLITAETEKLDHLKDHKKGLLQQLFPQAGETKPQLRFSDFENDGVWEAKKLNEVCDSIFDGTHQTPKYTEKGVPFFSVENIVSGNKNKFISKEDYLYETRINKPEFGDILITRIGNIGYSKVIDWEYDFGIYVTLAVIKKSDFFISEYLNGYFQSSRYQEEIRSKSLLNAVPMKINMEELRKTEILLPPTLKEQQKIANCISSLDNIITAETEKLDLLKDHKKGLMQQLFPNVNEQQQ